MMNRVEVSYDLGTATVTIPGKGLKKKPLVLKLTIAEGEALRKALEFNGMWAGSGYTHYEWPIEERKRGKRKLN